MDSKHGPQLEIPGSRGEPAAVSLLNGHVVEAPSKYVCAHRSVLPSAREPSFCSGQPSVQTLTTGPSAESK